MRLVSLLFILILSASCGQDGGGGSSSAGPKDNGTCSLNGRAIACEAIEGQDGQGVDLLESMIDAPIKITDAEIMFTADKSSTSQGRRISCSTRVKNGEIYRFAVRGQKLLVMTAEGSYEMERLSEGEGLMGAWVTHNYIDQGTRVTKQMSFLSTSRVIMRTNCEL